MSPRGPRTARHARHRSPARAVIPPSPNRPEFCHAKQHTPRLAQQQARYRRAAFGPDLELLARREGQLRRRPASRRRVRRDLPPIRHIARTSRYFLARAVRYLAADAGIRQFLDIGTGLPTVDNTHQVAQDAAPTCRIVYVDNDPIVLAHARALLTSSPQGACDYIDADLRDPGKILDAAASHPRLHPAHRADADGHHGPHRRRGRPPHRLRTGRRACPPAATWPCMTAATSARRSTRPRTATTRPARNRTTCAARPRSPGSSTAWTWSSPVWCRAHNGAPISAPSARATPTPKPTAPSGGPTGHCRPASTAAGDRRDDQRAGTGGRTGRAGHERGGVRPVGPGVAARPPGPRGPAHAETVTPESFGIGGEPPGRRRSAAQTFGPLCPPASGSRMSV